MHNLDILYGKYDYAKNVCRRKDTITTDLLMVPAYHKQNVKKFGFYPSINFIEDWITLYIQYSWYMLSCIDGSDISGLKSTYQKLRMSILKMKHWPYKS